MKAPKRTLVIIGISIFSFLFLVLLSTSIIFYYLYTNKTTPCSKDIESCKTVEKPIEEEKIVEKCDIDKIIADSKDRLIRVDTTYHTILHDSANVYPGCKNALENRITSMIEKQSPEDVQGFENLEYFIDDTFIISRAAHIWSVDIKTGSINLLWEAKNPGFLSVTNMYPFYDSNRTELVFQVIPTGMGGTASEEEALTRELKRMCSLDTHGLWRYDSSTSKFTRISPAQFAGCTNK